MALKKNNKTVILDFKKGQKMDKLEKLRTSAPTYEEVLEKFASLLHEVVEMDASEAKRANAEIAGTFKMVG